MAAADFNGDGRTDLVTANYTDSTASVLLNTTTPFAVTTPVVVADVPGMGVVEYNRTTGAFVQLNPGNPTNVSLLATDPYGDVFLDYRGYGVYRYSPSTGGFTLLAGVDAEALAVDAKGDAFISFANAGVGEFRLDGSAQLLTPVPATLLVANAQGDLAGEFVGYGVSRRTRLLRRLGQGQRQRRRGHRHRRAAAMSSPPIAGAGVGEFRPDGSAQSADAGGRDAAGGQRQRRAGRRVRRLRRLALRPLDRGLGQGQRDGRPGRGRGTALGNVFASFAGAGVGEFNLAGGARLVDASASPQSWRPTPSATRSPRYNRSRPRPTPRQRVGVGLGPGAGPAPRAQVTSPIIGICSSSFYFDPFYPCFRASWGVVSPMRRRPGFRPAPSGAARCAPSTRRPRLPGRTAGTARPFPDDGPGRPGDFPCSTPSANGSPAS